MPTFREAYDKWFSEYYKEEIERRVNRENVLLQRLQKLREEQEHFKMAIKEKVIKEYEDERNKLYQELGLERKYGDGWLKKN